MSQIELLPYSGKASYQLIQQYQCKVSFIIYAVVVTRPDIAFAASQLLRFLTNPSPLHQEAIDHVLLYLKHTANHALQLGQRDNFEVYSNASFADNILNRKSSQAYLM
jgi:hypothetical protein